MQDKLQTLGYPAPLALHMARFVYGLLQSEQLHSILTCLLCCIKASTTTFPHRQEPCSHFLGFPPVLALSFVNQYLPD